MRRARQYRDGLLVCFKCAIAKPDESFPRDRSHPNGIQGTCRECTQHLRKAFYWSNAEVRDRHIASAARWARENKAAARATRIAYKEQQRRDLADPYIRKLLTERGWPNAAITPELIELKRQQVQARRLAGAVRDVLEEFAPPKDPQKRQPPTAEEIEQARLAVNARYRAKYAATLEKERARIAAYKAAHPEKVAAQRERAKQRKQQQKNATPAGELAGQPQRETT